MPPLTIVPHGRPRRLQYIQKRDLLPFPVHYVKDIYSSFQLNVSDQLKQYWIDTRLKYILFVDLAFQQFVKHHLLFKYKKNISPLHS